MVETVVISSVVGEAFLRISWPKILGNCCSLGADVHQLRNAKIVIFCTPPFLLRNFCTAPKLVNWTENFSLCLKESIERSFWNPGSVASLKSRDKRAIRNCVYLGNYATYLVQINLCLNYISIEMSSCCSSAYYMWSSHCEPLNIKKTN